MVFVGAQQLTPPQPPAVVQGVPTHIVHHLYYDPADYNGNANYTLPFDISGQQGVLGYLLHRAPAHSLFIADLKRRLTTGLLDPNPPIAGRADLQTWIDALPSWLSAYNKRNGTSLSQVDVLSNAAGQRGLIQHFYSGLLDDELRALADVPGNAAAFAQLNSTPLPPPQPVPPSRLPTRQWRRSRPQSARPADCHAARGMKQSHTERRPDLHPNSPSVARTRPLQGHRCTHARDIHPRLALDASPDIAGYLVYRATDASDLVDLRWFGPKPEYPADPSTLALPQLTNGMWQPLSLTAGVGDPRLIGVVNDPRAHARDHDRSDRVRSATTGHTAREILGVYRLDEFDPTTPANQPGAFNYWIPGAAGGTAQLVTDTTAKPATSRVTGLRLGLGRGVSAVVVASYAGVVRVIGSQPVLRIAFIDGVQPGSTPPTPADPNAAPTWTALPTGASPSYAIVAVDIAGNLSAASTPFAPPAFVSV